jgi:3-phenylpropionate/cinnamic acid dioxygenase small subunit
MSVTHRPVSLYDAIMTEFEEIKTLLETSREAIDRTIYMIRTGKSLSLQPTNTARKVVSKLVTKPKR